MMTPSNIALLIDQIDSFPALSATVSRVLEITGNPESSAQELMQAILPDQSMCVAILKLANSAFFGRPRKVSSIEEAVVVLGFHEIRNIVLTQAVFHSFQKFRSTNKEDIDALWRHSLTCGLAARIIADHSGQYVSSSQFFIAGLIHDIGKLAMLMVFPQSYSAVAEIPEHQRLPNFLEEEEKYGISHDRVGLRLLNRWLFPETLCISVGYHHRPAVAPSNGEFSLIVSMADILSHIEQSQKECTGWEVLELMKARSPEDELLWKRYDFDWQEDDVENWLAALRTELADGNLLHLFND